jgi:hypothetical protein
MTEKIPGGVKEMMRDNKKKQSGCFIPGQNGWSGHVVNCIAANICPKCGNDIFIDEKLIDKVVGRIIFSECSTCDWKNYNYMETIPLKRLEAQ